VADFDFGDDGVLLDAGFRAMARGALGKTAGGIFGGRFGSGSLCVVPALVPEVRMEDMTPGGSGVRAQGGGADGALVDDFRFVARNGFYMC